MQLTRYRRPAWPQAVLQSPTTSRLPRSREQHYIAEVLLASSTHPLSSVSSRLNSISQEFKWPQFTVFFYDCITFTSACARARQRHTASVVPYGTASDSRHLALLFVVVIIVSSVCLSGWRQLLHWVSLGQESPGNACNCSVYWIEYSIVSYETVLWEKFSFCNVYHIICLNVLRIFFYHKSFRQ